MLKTLVRLTATPTPEPSWFEQFIERGRYRDIEDAGILGGKTKEWIIDGFIELTKALFELISPFIEWGCKIIIVSCVMIIFASGYERKYVAAALKWFVIFLIYCFIKGAVK